jgi:hypothetical protein
MTRKDWQIIGLCILVIGGIALLSPSCKGICKTSAIRLIGIGSKLL